MTKRLLRNISYSRFYSGRAYPIEAVWVALDVNMPSAYGFYRSFPIYLAKGKVTDLKNHLSTT